MLIRNSTRLKTASKDAAAGPMNVLSWHVSPAGDSLLVPLPAMWAFRALAAPAAISEAAGIAHHHWHYWRRRYAERFPWLFPRGESQANKASAGWLYHAAAPKGITIVTPGHTNAVRGKAPREDEFWVTAEMMRFREQSARKAIGKRARQAANGARLALQNGPRYWLRRLPKGLPWILPWLYCETDRVPDGITIATVAQIAAAQQAWHAEGIRAEIGLPHSDYCRWLGKIFPRERLLSFAKWLYGGSQPEGWFIITPKLVALRQRRSHEGIRLAAKLSKSWRADQPLPKTPKIRSALEAAKRGEPIELAEGDGLSDRTLRALSAYRQSASWSSTFADLQWGKQNWTTAKKAAEDAAGVRCRDALVAYVDGTLEALAGSRGRQTGAIAPGLFLPSEAMWRFREIAAQRSASAGIADRLGKIPRELVDAWFLDCVIPRAVGKKMAATGPARLPGPTTASEGGTSERALRTDADRLAESLRKCGDDRRFAKQRLLIQAAADLTAGKRSYWPLGKKIAARAGVAFDSNTADSLKKLCERGCLTKRAGRQGYRLA